MFCKVKGCRYPDFHVSSGHHCPNCKQFGHGQFECDKKLAQLISILYHNTCSV